jgi:hypothetical protein
MLSIKTNEASKTSILDALFNIDKLFFVFINVAPYH